MKEIWKSISGYDGLYEVSNLGRVRSLNYGRTGTVKVLKLSKEKEDYLQIAIRHKIYMIAKLVWETFNGPVPAGMQVNHKDEDKTNNFIWVNPDGSVDLEKSNLNLMTPKDNCNWGTRNERIRSKKLNKKCFKNEPKPVLQYDLTGIFLKEFPSIREAARQTDYSFAAIQRCVSGLKKDCHNESGNCCVFKFK